jgi:hypothetical protein
MPPTALSVASSLWRPPTPRELSDVIDTWHVLYNQFSMSPQDFYRSVEESLVARQVPGASLSRVLYREAGILSGSREYLRVSRAGVNFDICAAPFGTGFFFSWWLVRVPETLWGIVYLQALFLALLVATGLCFTLPFFLSLLALPFMWAGTCIALGVLVREGYLGSVSRARSMPMLGVFFERLFQPTTYFSVDSERMFKEAVKGAVEEAVAFATDSQTSREGASVSRFPAAAEAT